MFGVDIDETVTEDRGAFAQYMIQYLGLSMDVPPSFEAFLAHPEVKAYRKTHDETFRQCFEEARLHPTVLAALSPRDRAVEGVTTLQAYGRVAYYTARAVRVQTITQTWLRTHHFPDVEYFSCYNFLQKYFKLYLHTRETQEPAILIDDNAKKIADVWPQVVQKWPLIGEFFPERFVLVAFGYTSENMFPLDVPFPVVPLPNWESEHIDSLVSSILSPFKEEAFHG